MLGISVEKKFDELGSQNNKVIKFGFPQDALAPSALFSGEKQNWGPQKQPLAC